MAALTFPTEEPDVELIIPVRDEAERIRPTLEIASEYLSRQTYTSRLLVVDNGSLDTTPDIVRGFATANPIVRLLGCAHPGKGAAVRAGVLASNAPLVGFFDADLATPIDTLAPALAAIKDGFDIVVGSRRCPGATCLVAHSAARQVGAALFRTVTRALVPEIEDTQCGFKLFRGPEARALFARCRVDGFAFDVEVLALARQGGLSVRELPVQWTDRPGSSFRMRPDGLVAARDIIHLFARLWRPHRRVRSAMKADR